MFIITLLLRGLQNSTVLYMQCMVTVLKRFHLILINNILSTRLQRENITYSGKAPEIVGGAASVTGAEASREHAYDAPSLGIDQWATRGSALG